jgi:hypothetical protein
MGRHRPHGPAVSLSTDKIADLHVKHLELIQAIVTRCANYSATLKNYCITLATALAGFAITLHRPLVTLLSLLPIILFGLLDAQYLRIERRFSVRHEQQRPERTSGTGSALTMAGRRVGGSRHGGLDLIGTSKRQVLACILGR